MDVISMRILCYAGLKRTRLWQLAGKYTPNYKKRGGWNVGEHLEAWYEVMSILKVE